MNYEETIELASETGPFATQVISKHEDQIRELYDYLNVVRVAHTIGFKIQPNPLPQPWQDQKPSVA